MPRARIPDLPGATRTYQLMSISRNIGYADLGVKCGGRDQFVGVSSVDSLDRAESG